MKRQRILVIAFLLASLLLAPAFDARAQEAGPVVHAVLFYSPTCPHCEYVMTQTLPPLYEKYGGQLQIIGFDVTQPQGQAIFYSALDTFGVQEAGVPFLVIDNITLVGSGQIPEEFPGLVEAYLGIGGAAWPEIPGLREILISAAQTATAQAPTQSAGPQATVAPEGTSLPSSLPTGEAGIIQVGNGATGWRARFAADPRGNTLSVLVLVGMLAAVGWAVRTFRTTKGNSLKKNWAWSIPLLCVMGAAVAGYLAYVETAQVTAVCGPVGDCNTVQQSQYARLFGVLPIGTLGLIGYAAIVIAWLIGRYAKGRIATNAAFALFAMAMGGTLFSIYLTFLEPFVIGATCAWCLTSAVLMTILMLLSVAPAATAISRGLRSPAARRRHTRLGVADGRSSED